MICFLATKEYLTQISRYDKHLPAEKLAFCVEQGLVYAVKEEEVVVGILRFGYFWQTVPFMELLYIDENHRGKGYGTALCREWEKEMKSRGYTHLLTSTQSDENAWRFYEKLGYRKAGGFFPPHQQAEEWIYLKENK